RGHLESHPGNPEPPGRGSAMLPLGPHIALLVAANGLYTAQAGWLIAPPWRAHLAADGVVGTADAGDAGVWIAHRAGLFRLHQGRLAELKVGGKPVAGLTAVAAAPSPDGRPGVWFAWEQGLSVAVPTSAGFAVLDGDFSDEVLALAGLGAGRDGKGALWALTADGLHRLVGEEWEALAFDFEDAPAQLFGAGRYLWARFGERLLRYDADRDEWDAPAGLPDGPRVLLATDAAGAAWVRIGEAAFLVGEGAPPRLSGLDQNARVYGSELTVRAQFPASAPADKVLYRIDDGDTLESVGPNFSLGGDDLGLPRPLSLADLPVGRHVLTATAVYPGGAQAVRTVYFEYAPADAELLSWEKHLRPLNEARCISCHQEGPGRPLATYEQWKENAAAIVNATRDKRMPADGPLDPDSILRIQRWAQSGARP
ncbi:MAG: hypothetical protein ACK4N5_12755, partial [Myxococcales bacterium]